MTALAPGTRVLLTGATGGIGAVVAARLASAGCVVGLMARSDAELGRLASVVGGRTIALPADVRDADQVAGAVARLVGEAGGIDVWIDAAGVAGVGDLSEQLGSRIDQMIDTNLLGAMLVASAVSRQMVRQGQGHIALIPGAIAWHGMPKVAAYSATKAGLRGFGEALWHELGPSGVQVTLAYPAALDTRLRDHDRQRIPWLSELHVEDPEAFVDALLHGIERDRRRVYFPAGHIRNMIVASGLSPRFVNFAVRQMRGQAAAPRR